ncbi:YhjD/YihY/BrkB family envelope integrity protein [Actinopolymorpha pittospori]
MEAGPSGARPGIGTYQKIRASVAWRLARGTIRVCLRYRVTGLAAEGAFFAILSLPPLVFGLAGSVGYVVGGFGPEAIETVRRELVELARRALTEQSVQSVIVPTVNAVLERGRAEVISIGFVLALWSGSRALNVFIDTITIMYGMGGRRGIVRTRILSFTMYVIALAIGIVVIPLVLAGPTLVDALLPTRLDFLATLYWPIVMVVSTAFLTTLYHLALPERTPWLHDLGGAVLAMLLWLLGSFLLRTVLSNTVGSTSIYGPLAAPIAVLLWLYVIVISLLVGAAFNATLHAHLEQRAERRAEAEREQEPAATRPVEGPAVGDQATARRDSEPVSESTSESTPESASEPAADERTSADERRDADEETGVDERPDAERTAEEAAEPEADRPGSPPDQTPASEGTTPSQGSGSRPEDREATPEHPAVTAPRGSGVRAHLPRPGRAEPPGPARGRSPHPKAK